MPRFTVTFFTLLFTVSSCSRVDRDADADAHDLTQAAELDICVNQLPIAVTKYLRKTSSEEERLIGFTILEVSLHGRLDLGQHTHRVLGKEVEQSSLSWQPESEKEREGPSRPNSFH